MADIVRHPEQIVERNRRTIELRPELIKSLPDHLDEIDAVYAELAGRAG
jgi:hypothetical protein